MSDIFAKNSALKALLNAHLDTLASEEGLSPEAITEAIAKGTMVLLANPSHKNVKPILVGQPSRIKVNANIGTSPLCNNHENEMEKLDVAVEAGADTVMDLSIAGDLDAIRVDMLARSSVPLGTVPMYAVGQKIIDAGREISSMSADELFEEVERQAVQGVDFMTLHCGLSYRGAQMGAEKTRAMGIVSRGGSMLARWMLENKKENPLIDHFDRLIEIARKWNVTLSLGDGLRPGAGVDAGDAAQMEEVINLGQLQRRALAEGVQCMIEGPGHVALNLVKTQIQGIKTLTNGAPLYVLGPLTVDATPGYDHISGAIGGALGVTAGVDFLCYLTPAEHLTLPDKEDVKAGVMASRIAAHAGEVALGTPRAKAREAAMNKARRALDWEGMKQAALDPAMVDKRRIQHHNEEVCAMCGKFCAVKMLKEAKIV
ncbi:MAG: phosphomethylpyrimidine synthase ThiC [Desulfovibrio sp.]|nr:phosphomethylpyrimidine synthase ThiC [Desulfovibrio sp.]